MLTQKSLTSALTDKVGEGFKDGNGSRDFLQVAKKDERNQYGKQRHCLCKSHYPIFEVRMVGGHYVKVGLVVIGHGHSCLKEWKKERNKKKVPEGYLYFTLRPECEPLQSPHIYPNFNPAYLARKCT
jgi:hypothetical protein